MSDDERTPDQKRKEELRGKARHAVQLASAIADQQGSRAPNVYAPLNCLRRRTVLQGN
jgi:hypothetical protein